MTFTVIIILLAIAVFWAVKIYNTLVTSRNGYRNAFAQIDVQLKRRFDLIPNLVESVKGIMKFEQETLTMVISARNGAVSAASAAASNPGGEAEMKNLAAASASLNGALGKFFALAEAYPDLKASSNMQSLQEELASTENKVAFARQAFNDAVMTYNNNVEVFPNSVIAGMKGFNQAALLESTEAPEERKVVKVSF